MLKLCTYIFLLSLLVVTPVYAIAQVFETTVCAAICELATVNEAGVKEITYDQFQEIRNSGEKFFVFDALPKESYDAGHIEGALSLPYNTIVAENAVVNIPSKDAMVIVYCANFDCHASTKAALALMDLGYTNVVDYKGGLKEWQEKGNELVS